MAATHAAHVELGAAVWDSVTTSAGADGVNVLDQRVKALAPARAAEVHARRAIKLAVTPHALPVARAPFPRHAAPLCLAPHALFFSLRRSHARTLILSQLA